VKRRASAVAGLLLLAVAVGFCARTFLDERRRVEDALADARPAWLLVAVALAAAAMASLALGWGRCLGALGSVRPAGAVARWYFLGELGKYVPGGLWPIVGRGELARRAGVAATVAYQSVLLSLAAWYGAALLPAALVGSHPAVQSRAAGLVARLTRGRVAVAVLPWRTLLRLVASYLPTWALVAGATAAAVAAYGGPPGWRAPAVAVAAWVLGFLAVPVPAGAGVREAAFVAASGLPAGLALTVAVTSRLAFVVVDLVGALVAAATQRHAAPFTPDAAR
jgi:uncharacterized membrane protein YbhN (UPF0104 family)